MKTSLKLLAAVVVLFASTHAWAWGKDGHQIVAAIAQQHLTPEAQAGIQQLLGSAHIYDTSVSSWADDVRTSMRGSAPWHFADIPLSAKQFSASRDCEEGNCVVERIDEFVRVIANKSADTNQRVEALKFVVHLVGDIHQPLHNEDDHDRGGNEVAVKYPGQRRTGSLHSTWDSYVLDELMGERQPLEYADALDLAIKPDQIARWTTSPSSEPWANEAHALAQRIYQELPPAGSDGVRVLKSDYAANHKAALEQQLQMGGIRLARLLNLAFGASAAKPAPAVPVYPADKRQHLVARSLRD